MFQRQRRGAYGTFRNETKRNEMVLCEMVLFYFLYARSTRLVVQKEYESVLHMLAVNRVL